MDLLDGLATLAAPQHGVEHVVRDDRVSAAVLALRAAASRPSKLDSRVFSRSASAIAAKNENSSLSGPVGP
ncbi:hypothetical protein GCM10010496_33100 [Streptomyces asoensis]|nr:hypothetical protein GCM10010496_33100 [Streptomyces asoensis]